MHEKGRGGPRLRRAAHRIATGRAPRCRVHAAEQLGQPLELRADARLVERAHHRERRARPPVQRHAEHHDRVVVGPDRAVVVAHRVEDAMRGAQGADPPAGEHVRARAARRATGAACSGVGTRLQSSGPRCGHGRQRALGCRRAPARTCPAPPSRTARGSGSRSSAASRRSAAAALGLPESREQLGHSHLRVVDVPWTSTSAIGGSGSRPSGKGTPSPESFQPWLTSPLAMVRAYSTKPSPSRSP